MSATAITIYGLMTFAKVGNDYQPVPLTKPDVQACSEMMDPSSLNPKWSKFTMTKHEEDSKHMHYVFQLMDKELDLECDGLAVTVRERPRVTNSICIAGGQCVTN